ncbi:MAG: protein kinase [Victivallales bacterium]|nr:protein kinase [Victivallales bacterium]
MGRTRKHSDSSLDFQTTMKADAQLDSDQLGSLLSGETQNISLDSIKKIFVESLTRKPPRKYRHPEKIGKGGMKEIIKVRDRDTARDLAMAVLSEDTREHETNMTRFVYEARITANLEHPNIVPIHDIGLDNNGKPYFTMKLIEGESLAHVLMNIASDAPRYREKYNMMHLINIFLNVCNAIDFAHSKNIIHLDLKPENIQIGSYGEVLVVDWGLAKSLEERNPWHDCTQEAAVDAYQKDNETPSHHTMDGEIKGTPGFMAPEQAAGHNHLKNTLTDIYSLGALLYSMLTLKKPVRGTEIADLLDKTMAGDIIHPLKRSPERNIPPPLAAIALKAMALRQEDRYQTVDELIKDIQNYTENYATSAEKPNALHHMRMFFKRHRTESIFGLCVLILIAVLIRTFVVYETKRFADWGRGRLISPASEEALHREWLPSSGKWEVRDNALHAVQTKGGDSYILLYSEPSYGNIALEFDAEVPDPEDLLVGGDLSIILAASEKEPSKRGYFLQIGGVGNTSAIIQKRGGFQASVDFSLQPARKYRVRAEKEGPQLRLFCDGRLLLSTKDIFYLEDGFFGIYTFGKGKVFSNIKVFTKELPELVPPTVEGDGFYRESRKLSGKEKQLFLELAKDSYTRVYNSKLSSGISSQALLKRAYVNSELGDLKKALHDTILLSGYGETMDLFLLQGMLYFKTGQIEQAHDIFTRVFRRFPNDRVTPSSTLMGYLSDTDSHSMSSEMRQKLWRLCAENFSSSAFRCNARHLDSIEFMRGLEFSLIDCSENDISTLEPLSGMALRQLDCADNPVSNISPLRGLNLEYLELHNTSVSDISVLAGMPLRALSLSGCTELHDLSALKSLPKLERLTIPEQVTNLEFLGLLPNLKTLNNQWDGWKMTKDEFLRKKEQVKIKIKRDTKQY